MIIKENLKLVDIQTAFQEKYPFLKLEFYSKDHEAGEGSEEKYKLDSSKTIADVRSKHNEGEISIHGNLKVSSLEDDFDEIFGLHVQVFRRSGEIYLQTTATDHWTLAEQNEKGEQES